MNHVVEGCNTPKGVGSLDMRTVSKICANPLFIFTRLGSPFSKSSSGQPFGHAMKPNEWDGCSDGDR